LNGLVAFSSTTKEKTANKPVNNVREKRGENVMEDHQKNLDREGMETESCHESVGSNPTPGATINQSWL